MNLHLEFWLTVADALAAAGAWQSRGLRWRLYLWAIDRAAGVTDWGME